jgi:uncharacterized protein (DUF3820 family)
MSSQPENPDPVQKLLSLKRHEVPPPRYFSDFSGRVIAHLDEPERIKTWWQRLGFNFDLQPAMVCALGMVVSALLLFGVLASLQMSEPRPVAFRSDASDGAEPMVLTPPGAPPAVAGLNNLMPIAKPEDFLPSTFPVVSASASASPFGQFQGRVQRVSWNGN